MRKLVGAALMAAMVSACSAGEAQVPGTGSGGQREFAVGGFDRIESAGPYNVIVRVGAAPSVRAEGDERALERLRVEARDGRLWIGTKPGNWGPLRGRATVHVTVPSLRAASLAGSGNLDIGPLRTDSFDARIAGSGNLVLERVETDTASFDIAGSGNLRAAGRARQARLDIAGSGQGELGGLEAQDARVSIAGSGSADISATGTAEVRIMGSGDVSVTGGARCSVSRIGSGSVQCG